MRNKNKVVRGVFVSLSVGIRSVIFIPAKQTLHLILLSSTCDTRLQILNHFRRCFQLNQHPLSKTYKKKRFYALILWLSLWTPLPLHFLDTHLTSVGGGGGTTIT